MQVSVGSSNQSAISSDRKTPTARQAASGSSTLVGTSRSFLHLSAQEANHNERYCIQGAYATRN